MPQVRSENHVSESKTSYVISYTKLRLAIGVLAILFPFLLALGGLVLFGTEIQYSVSDYYHTDMRDVFVGILFAIGLFLFSYKGPQPKDDRAGDFACLCAVGMALFPTAPAGLSCTEAQLGSCLHGLFAALFFLTLIYFCLYLFVKTDSAKVISKRKLQRNLVYRVCGYTMLGCIILVAVVFFLPESIAGKITPLDPVFWLETVAIVAFSVSWLTKGEAILGD